MVNNYTFYVGYYWFGSWLAVLRIVLIFFNPGR